MSTPLVLRMGRIGYGHGMCRILPHGKIAAGKPGQKHGFAPAPPLRGAPGVRPAIATAFNHPGNSA